MNKCVFCGDFCFIKRLKHSRTSRLIPPGCRRASTSPRADESQMPRQFSDMFDFIEAKAETKSTSETSPTTGDERLLNIAINRMCGAETPPLNKSPKHPDLIQTLVREAPLTHPRIAFKARHCSLRALRLRVNSPANPGLRSTPVFPASSCVPPFV